MILSLEEKFTSACRNQWTTLKNSQNNSKIRVSTGDLIYTVPSAQFIYFEQEYPNLPWDAIIHIIHTSRESSEDSESSTKRLMIRSIRDWGYTGSRCNKIIDGVIDDSELLFVIPVVFRHPIDWTLDIYGKSFFWILT